MEGWRGGTKGEERKKERGEEGGEGVCVTLATAGRGDGENGEVLDELEMVRGDEILR